MLFSAFTRHITISGQTILQSGEYSSFNVSGFDINGDGSTTNDRPVLSNISAPLTSVAIDGKFLIKNSLPGTYYDRAAYNASPSTARVFKLINASDAHFLIPDSSVGAGLLSREVGRGSFANPGLASWDVAVEKAVPTTFAHLENGQLIFRVEAQDVANHNNVSYLNTNVGQVGQSTFLNTSNARDTANRHLRLWAKFTF